MEELHQVGQIINQRYRILYKLGQGGVGITYAALDLQTSEQVALKVLSIRRISEWKKMELFEREAKILSQLNHPAIPRYLDYFQVDTNSDHFFYIAQQLAPGNSLSMLVENGWRPHEGEIRQIATQILEILIYLHSLVPPVIHRDIKPQNLILSLNYPQCNEVIDCLFNNYRLVDLRVFLVDFGAVADSYHNTLTGGSTVVGTFGYMAPEQFHSKAFPSTDLYALGATLLFLLTGKSPVDLPQNKLKINFRDYVCTEAYFASWLERMLEPVITDRFSSAEDALLTLLGQKVLRPQLPKKTHLLVSDSDNNSLTVEVPPSYLYNNFSLVFLFFSIALIGVLVLIYWVIIIDYIGLLFLFFLMSIFTCFFSLCSEDKEDSCAVFVCFLFKLIFFKPLSSLINFFINLVSTTLLQINQHNISLEKYLFNCCIQKITIFKSDIITVEFDKKIGSKFSDILIFYCLKSSCSESVKKHFRFGNFLAQHEKEWLMWEIRNR
jgi:eukaryotic-like serine/threonine-protein kinase